MRLIWEEGWLANSDIMWWRVMKIDDGLWWIDSSSSYDEIILPMNWEFI